MFVSEIPHDIARSASPRRRRRFIFLAIILVMIGVFVGYSVWGATRIFHGVTAARAALSEAQSFMMSAEFSQAQEKLVVAQKSLNQVQGGVTMFRYLHMLPWVGEKYLAGVALIDATEKTVDVLLEAATIAGDIYAVVEDARATLAWQDPARAHQPLHDMSPAVKAALFSRLANALPELRTMQVKLALAEEDLAYFYTLPLSQEMIDALAPFSSVLKKLSVGIDFLVPFAGITRELVGLEGDRQFLLMFLNNTELRPTGGFLGTYGLVVVEGGDMKSLTTDDTYAVDALVANNDQYFIPSPLPIAKYLEQPVWYFRDGTWSPDFATGAQETIALFRQEIAAAGQPVPEIHGAIGITATFFEDLLRFLGPVTVDGTVYTADNVVDTLEYQVEIAFEQQGVAREDRKDIVGRFANIVLDRVLELPPSRFEEVFALFVQAFTQKDFALWMRDPATQAVLDDAGWSQKIAGQESVDTLMVVDANMASLKSDPVVKRAIRYHLRPQGKSYEATVSITYDHQGSFDWKTSRYRTYTRIFVPQGSRLLAVDGSLENDALRNPQALSGEVVTQEELGLTSFGTFIAIEPGHQGTLTFTYLLPESIAEAIRHGTYALHLLKQMGAADHDIALNLDFDLPVRKASPPEQLEAWGDDTYVWQSLLEENKEIRVDF